MANGEGPGDGRLVVSAATTGESSLAPPLPVAGFLARTSISRGESSLAPPLPATGGGI